MNSTASAPFSVRQFLAAALVGLGLVGATLPVHAQSPLMHCADPVPQDPSRVFRSGLWKQWIYWAIPGPSAYAAVQRIVAEANVSRATAGLPYLIPNPTFEIVVSVFDERNARGANGSSALPMTANQEAFLATFVTDTQGGFEVLFLTDPMRSNDILTTAKAVPGVAASIERRIESRVERGVERIETDWDIASASGDRIRFSARYPASAVYAHTVAPAARVDYANCDLVHVSDIVYRSAPTRTFPLFAREEGNYVDLRQDGVQVRVHVRHHDPDVHAIFNDPANVPELLIGVDRDVRIESR